jgi:hypothetical protein
MKTDIIVARYNENVEWLNSLNSKAQIFLYNKGQHSDDSIQLPNIGREAHTYIHHIISNYNNLSDYNIFCQGDPFPHCGNFISHVNSVVDGAECVNEFKWLTNGLYNTLNNGGPYHTVDLRIDEYLSRIGMGHIDVSGVFQFGPGAQFIATGECLRKRPVEFYMGIIQTFDLTTYDQRFRDSDYIEGRSVEQFYHIACILERVWEKILTVY